MSRSVSPAPGAGGHASDLIGARLAPQGAGGYASLERGIGDPSVPVGVEGASSYGAGLADYLQAAGYEVYEMLRPKRDQRRSGKSDPIDAIAAARNLAAGDGLTPKARGGAAGDIRWLMIAREQAVRHMTALSNCIDSIIVTAPDALRAKLGGESGEARIRRMASTRPDSACGKALKRLAKRWIEAKKEADELESEIEALVKEAYPSLIEGGGHERTVVEADVSGILVLGLAKFLEKPGLANLTCAVDDERLSPLGILPPDKVLHQKAIHNYPLTTYQPLFS